MIPVVTGLLSLGKIWMRGRQELQAAKQKQDVAETEQKTKLIQSSRNHNNSWELAALSADRLSHLRLLSFFLYTVPIVYTVVDPVAAAKVWVALNAVPDWVIGVQLAMTGFIWAAKPLSNLGAAMAGRSKGL